MPGMVTPATIGWNIVSSSWRPRKYHGAFDGFGVRFGFASSRSGALTNVEKIVSAPRTSIIATNSSISRWGHTLMRSPCSRSTRWIPSGGTSASSRCFSGAPRFGSGTLPVGAGAWRSGAVSVAAATAAAGAATPTAAGAAPAAGAAAEGAATAGAAAAGAAAGCGAAPSPAAGAGAGGAAGPSPDFARAARRAAALARPSATRRSAPLPTSSARTRSKVSWSSDVSSRAMSPSPLERSRDAAVLADPPEGDREEDHQDERQGEHVQDVPPEQGVRTHDHPTEQQEVGLLRDQRRVTGERRPDRDRPHRQLVPREQVAGERQSQREEQQQHTH